MIENLNEFMNYQPHDLGDNLILEWKSDTKEAINNVARKDKKQNQ